MKKLIGTVAALLLVASAAFAELRIGGGATAIFAPVASDGEDMKSLYIQPWGGACSSSVSFSWISEDEKAGSEFCYVNDPYNTSAVDGSAVIWVKPIDMVKISFGHYKQTKLEKNLVATASWNWARPGTWVTGDSVFQNIEAPNPGAGAMIEVEPIDGLYFVAGLPVPTNGGDAFDTWEGVAVAAAYTIDGIGTIQAQWKGAQPTAAIGTKVGTDLGDKGSIQAAFTLDAVENLSLTAAMKFHLYDKDYLPTSMAYIDKVTAGLAASYQVTDAFSVAADFGIQTYEVEDPTLSFGIGPGYGISDQLSAAADFRAVIPTTDDMDPTFSFLVGLDYACSTNGSIGIGFQGIICGKNNGKSFPELTATGTKKDPFLWAVPIKMSVNF